MVKPYHNNTTLIHHDRRHNSTGCKGRSGCQDDVQAAGHSLEGRLQAHHELCRRAHREPDVWSGSPRWFDDLHHKKTERTPRFCSAATMRANRASPTPLSCHSGTTENAASARTGRLFASSFTSPTPSNSPSTKAPNTILPFENADRA